MRKEKGITLIALVITIIVLLILASVSINTLIGKNGILNKTKEAKEKNEIANEEENIRLAITEAQTIFNSEKLSEKVKGILEKNLGENKVSVDEAKEQFYVIYNDSKRIYKIKEKTGEIIYNQFLVKDDFPGDISRGKNGEELDGSKENPYEIWCIEDLLAFSNIVSGEGISFENGERKENVYNTFKNKHVALMTNLDFSSKHSYMDSQRTDFGDINEKEDDGNVLINEMNTGRGFKPIGMRKDGAYKYFTGIFNGKSNTIDNIYINYSKDNIRSGYNLGRGVAFFRYTGKETIIENLKISGKIIGDGHASGIAVGGNSGIIRNCTNYANIEGKNFVGGIVSQTNYQWQIENCKNYGELGLIGEGPYSAAAIGGIIGGSSYSNKCIIKSCENRGKVYKKNSSDSIGGILGSSGDGTKIEECSNYSSFDKNSTSGGILGRSLAGKTEIINCANFGNADAGILYKISGGSWDGLAEVDIKNSYNLGNSTKSGIIGFQFPILKRATVNLNNVYNAGESENAIIGNISDRIENVDNISNTYYDKSKSKNIGAVSNGIKDFKIKGNTDFVDLLNSNIKDSTWLKWKMGEDGYPTFE